MRRWLAILLLLTLAGCSSVPFKPTPPGPTRELAAGELLSGLWTGGERVWRIRQSALFEFRHARVPMTGFLVLDTGRRQARLVGLNDLGVKLFDITVTPEEHRENYLFPQLAAIPEVGGAIAAAVRHIFLEPRPAAGDRLRIEAAEYRLSRTEGERQILFLFGGATPRLLEKRVEGKDGKWRARYFEYRSAGGTQVPGGIVLEDERGGYRLTLWLEEVKTDDEQPH